MAYPVGSIYISVNNTNPSTLFGGTWEQLQDRFLLACSSTYTAGSTGGEATHTLTASEMPNHDHNVVEENNVRTGSWGKYDVYALNNGQSGSGHKYYNLSATAGENSWSYSGYHGLMTDTAGGGQAHNNMPPYLAVYMWKRTA